MVLVLLLVACEHEPQVGPLNPIDGGGGPPASCDTDTVWFQQEVLPLFIARCAECHRPPNPADGIDLTSHGSIMGGNDIVRPYDTNRKLYRRITDPDNDDRMPPAPRPRLTANEMETIRRWIMQGARNTSCVEAGCDTLGVTWSGTIAPLIRSHCSGCHNGPSSQSGIDLTNWTVVNSLAVQGVLMASIQGAPGAIRMPPSGPLLPDCRVRQFLIWTAAGAPNN